VQESFSCRSFRGRIRGAPYRFLLPPRLGEQGGWIINRPARRCVEVQEVPPDGVLGVSPILFTSPKFGGTRGVDSNIITDYVGAYCNMPFLDCPIKSGNDGCEVSFRGRTGGYGGVPHPLKPPPFMGDSRGLTKSFG